MTLQPRHRRVLSEITAYADQFAELANQVRGLDLEDQDTITVSYLHDSTLIASADGHPDVIVTKDVTS